MKADWVSTYRIRSVNSILWGGNAVDAPLTVLLSAEEKKQEAGSREREIGGCPWFCPWFFVPGFLVFFGSNSFEYSSCGGYGSLFQTR
jgi:hypothetical protein